ncbi:MAG: hypothetical protein QGG73_12040 [Candidatus Hydrogenedentes bacterium]|jgi:hypothetical protein|nr:hypothetical protein [Candidatus Hydrogenedentota bacterium]
MKRIALIGVTAAVLIGAGAAYLALIGEEAEKDLPGNSDGANVEAAAVTEAKTYTEEELKTKRLDELLTHRQELLDARGGPPSSATHFYLSPNPRPIFYSWALILPDFTL